MRKGRRWSSSTPPVRPGTPTGGRWFVDETYIKVAGTWTYLHHAVDQHGQLIDVLVSRRRDAAAARSFFASHVTEQYANNVIESEHGRLKARLRPMRGLKRLASAHTISAGHAFVHNLRRGHYAITPDLPVRDRVRVAFRLDEAIPLFERTLTDRERVLGPDHPNRLCCVGRSGCAGHCPSDWLKSALPSAPAGYRFPREAIAVAARWYLRYGLSYRDAEELVAERGTRSTT